MTIRKPRKGRWLLVLMQAMLSLGLMYWLLTSLDWRMIVASWARIDLRWVAVSVLFYYLNLAISCYKWKLTLAWDGLHAPFSRLIRWYLIGAFANNFLPGEFGGDLGRGALAARMLGNPAGIARSILIERLTGLSVLLVLAAVSATLLFNIWWFIPASLIGVIGVLLLTRSLGAALLKHTNRLGVLLQQARERLLVARRAPWDVAQLLIASLVFQSLSCLGVWLNMRAVHIELDAGRTFQVAAMAAVAGALPVSLNGWGVREGFYTTLLHQVPSAEILAGALFGRALGIVLTLGGAFAWMLEPTHQPKVDAHNE
jgi:glycosyltransferase 2 family protein